MKVANLDRVAAFRARVTRTGRRIALSVAAAVVSTATAGHAPAAAPAANDVRFTQPSGAEANLRPEVRLRKLHLVRPDLIQYPLAYEVYC